MQRFFSHHSLEDTMIWTESDRIHQITRVLRLQKGESIVVFDGDGSESEYRITHQEKRAIHLERIQKLYPKHRESDIHITLYQALPNKHEKLEWIIQKSVEIGIKKVIFFRSDRSQKLVISDAKKVRYGLIAQEALEQCGGLVPLEIEYLDHIPENDESKIHIVLHPEGEPASLMALANHPHMNWGIWVGPEGGWSTTEIQKMNNYGYLIVRFSQRILRTETAGIVTAFGLLHAKHNI